MTWWRCSDMTEALQEWDRAFEWIEPFEWGGGGGGWRGHLLGEVLLTRAKSTPHKRFTLSKLFSVKKSKRKERSGVQHDQTQS